MKPNAKCLDDDDDDDDAARTLLCEKNSPFGNN
jgi:hypothetical protein